jgi:guanine deaminase
MSTTRNEPLRRTVYVGTFIHSQTLQKLDICENGAIGVDQHGKITFVERDAGNIDSITAAHGWEDAHLIRTSGCQFYFPGFIG